MITLTRFNGRVVVVNAELIKIVESTPDTIVTLISGETVTVREPVEEVVRLVIDYRRQVHGLRVV